MESQRVGHDLATEQQQISIKYISCNTFLSPPHNELSKSESEVAQLCPTLCDPMDWGSLPGFSVHGIFQARVLEWLPFPSPGDLPNPGIEPRSPALQTDT